MNRPRDGWMDGCGKCENMLVVGVGVHGGILCLCYIIKNIK